ncbi:hypothetical protein Clacol_009240 [Clathrus columnatus]|uniref:Uncharacterized protein n=1 Tax=Clathrus columnatus TaxID=1419009 RepID=A0AAV5AKM4_9AGAM|nr:hypothetical protein Clacol_009240 [Clathrus columnatus]
MQQLPQDLLLQIYIDHLLDSQYQQLDHFFHEFTKTPSIWLSLLQRLKLLLPPGQPIVKGALGHHTAEYLISRSMRFQQKWRWDYNPLPGYYKFDCPKRVLSIVSLPGGKHMISVHDEGDTENTVQNVIIVWDMSFRGRRNHAIIAVLRLGASIHRLQARYALVGGHISLVIAYVQSPSEDSLSRITTVTVKYAHLALLNETSRLSSDSRAYEEFMQNSPGPFENLFNNSTQHSVGAISLSEINGLPILAVVHRSRTIVIYHLISRTRSTLRLLPLPDYGEWRHSIWNIKLLSSQEHVFVIRTLINPALDADDYTPIAFELYNFPPADGSCDDEEDHDCDHDVDDDRPQNHPVQFGTIMDYIVESCCISDGEASWNFRTHPDPDIPMLHMFSRSSPPPLSVFLTTKEKRGFIHFLMPPENKSPENHGYYYKLPATVHARYEWQDREAPIIFPGAYHSIVAMRSPPPQPLRGISVLQLCAYRTESYEFSGPKDINYYNPRSDDALPGSDEMGVDIPMAIGGTESLRNRAMKYPALPDLLAQSMRQGTRSLQFDEWLGRLFIVTSNDPDTIHVLDWSL